MKNIFQHGQLVSIIMPAYNCEKFIEEAVNSVFKQTYDSWELIIIDDLSNDNTVAIIEKLSTRDNRIRFFRNEFNLGVSKTRNKGINMAKGDWIAFLDSDDIWSKEKLEKQIIFANNYKVNFIFTGSSFVNENSIPYKGNLNIPNRVDYKQLLKHNIISCSSVLIKKVYMLKYRMERDDTHEDFGTWLRVLKEEPFAYGINEPLLIYRISNFSKSSNKIKSLIMAYKTYRFIGINPLVTLYYLCWYIIMGLKKYKNIYK